MSGELVPKLRVVRCPKCRQLLQEPPGYDVYKCGGCGTALQAKKRKNVAVNSESSTPETDHVSKGEKCSNREHVVPSREDKLKSEAATSSSSSSGECYVDGKVGRDNGQYNGDQLVPVNLSDDQELESELDTYQLSHRRRRVSQKGCSNDNTHSEIEEMNSGSLSEGSKEELICGSQEDGNSDKSTQIRVKSEMETNEGDFERAEELNSESDGEDAKKDNTTLAGANPEVEITRSDLEGAEELNDGNLLQEGEEQEISCEMDGEDDNKEKSALVGDNLEVETNGSYIAGEELNSGKLPIEGVDQESNVCELDGDNHNNDQLIIEDRKSEVKTTKSATAIKSSSTEKGSILHVTPGKLEESTSGNHVAFSKQQKQAQKNAHRSSDRVRSEELVNPSSELSDILGKFSKSPTAGSSYAYDGSLSSYDGREERFPIQHLDTYPASNGVSARRAKRDKGLEAQLHSHLSNGKHHLQNNMLEATRHGHRSSMRTKRDEFPPRIPKRDEFPPRIPFHRSSSHSLYERGSSSNKMHDKHYFNSSFLSPDSYEDTDQEKMKLLRMIQNLQNQLSRTRYANGETNGRYKGNHISSYHSHDVHERRFSDGMDYICNGRCSHGINWHQRQKISRIPYSSEATSSAHNSCFCCSSQERHFSADIRPHPHGRCTDCYSSHHSYSSSPQYFASSKLPIYGLDTNSDDQRQRVSEVRKYVREKQNLAKRHHKPVAGGAPFVTCHKCLKLLKIPSDFLLYRRLKCGECSEVLKFSLQNGRHIVSLSPNSTGLPSSELNNQSNVTSASHANYYQYSPAEAISCYDDYGISVSNSYSSEVYPVSLTQFPHLHGSRKFSSEIEPKSSSLHKLMGYSSPSQVIRGKVTRSYSVEKESHDSLQRKDQE